MSTELDSRAILSKIVKRMSNADTQQMLAYAAGYEAGKISQIHVDTDSQPRESPKQTA